MQKLEVLGGKKLRGQIKISGSKNASLPILAATLLSDQKIHLSNLPRVKDIETISIPLPTADVPSYVPLVVPPSDLQEPEGTKPVETAEPPAPTLPPPFPPYKLPTGDVLVPTAIAAVTAVAATTITQPIIEKLRKKIQKFLQDKIKKWKENRKKKRESLQSSKKT